MRGMSTTRRPGRIARAFVGVLLASLLIDAQVAAAHGSSDDATNYSSRVLDPADPRLTWSIRGGDALLELSVERGTSVVVEGYQREPYLEFRQDGTVWANLHSPAHYQNTSRYGTDPLPPVADASAAPDWAKVANSGRYSWHDHRIHWMSPLVPEGVESDPDVDQRLLSWTIPLLVDGVDTEVTGELWWVAPSAWWPFVLALGAVFALIALLAVARTSPDGENWPVPARAVVVVLGLVGAANVVRVIDDMVASSAGRGEQWALAIGSAVSLTAIILLARSAWHGTTVGYLSLLGAGLATLLIFGGGATDMLTASQISTVLPLWVRRGTVAASYVSIVPVTVVVGAAAIHFARHYRGHQPSGAGAAGSPGTRNGVRPTDVDRTPS